MLLWRAHDDPHCASRPPDEVLKLSDKHAHTVRFHVPGFWIMQRHCSPSVPRRSTDTLSKDKIDVRNGTLSEAIVITLLHKLKFPPP